MTVVRVRELTDRPDVAPGPRIVGVVWGPCLVVAGAALAIVASGVRGADYPAHLLRALLWERFGMGVWNTYWYGGHPTPTYSVLAPPLTALVGPFWVAAVGSLLATYAWSRLTSDLLPGRWTALANHAFALSAVVNIVVGRAPFALGLAAALSALLAWHLRRFRTSRALAVLTPFASPVAAAFLAVAATSVALERWRRCRSGRLVAPGVFDGLGIAVFTSAPVLVMAMLYESPGRFPFRGDQFVISVLAGLLVVGVHRHPVVRVGAALTIVVSVGVFLVPNPLGGNFLRLTQLAAVPLAISGAHTVRRRLTVPLAALIAVGAGWSVQPGLVAALDWAGDASVDADYHQPLIDEVLRRNGDGRPLGRLEIPFTENHWESFFVAPAVPYARGWERQVDLDRNAALYEEHLSLSDYHDWLLDNAVRWVAVADVDLDEGGRAERELVGRDGTAHDIPWLRSVWANDDWRLYEVLDYRPIVDPPAELVHQESDRFIIRTAAPAVVTIRFEYTDTIVVDGPACVDADRDGWIVARFPDAGVYEFTVDPAGALPGASDDGCGAPAVDPVDGGIRDRPRDRAESVPYE